MLIQGRGLGRGGSVGKGVLEPEATGILTQEADPGGTMILHAHIGFNELNRLSMLWKVHYHWMAGAMYAFNCCKHWAYLILHNMGIPLVKLLSQEGVTQIDPLSVVLYGITLFFLVEDLQAADLGIIIPFYVDNAVFDKSARRSAHLWKLLLEKWQDWEFPHNPAKSMFIADLSHL